MTLKNISTLSILVIFICLIVFCLMSGVIGSFLIPYSINSWLLYAGKTVVVTRLQGFLWGLFPVFGFGSIPASFLTWIAMLFLL